ncbi:hypothetical protein ACOMHN_062288 [Nucella lapillus]
MATSMEEFLEQQWEQSAQFFMEESKHFDVASLLNQMHHLKSENTRLEEQIKALRSHRDHLLSTNARLTVPFASGSGASSDASMVEMTAFEKSQGLVELGGSQNKSHHLTAVSIPPPPTCLWWSPSPVPWDVLSQAVMYSVVAPPPHIPLPGFQQLVQTAGTKAASSTAAAADSKHRDKT